LTIAGCERAEKLFLHSKDDKSAFVIIVIIWPCVWTPPPPHDTDDISSINNLFCKEECSLTYVKIDVALKVIRELGRFSLCSKFNIESAFKQLGIRRDQGHNNSG
jgi:hypothetical protein